jgi:hypothetical protein
MCHKQCFPPQQSNPNIRLWDSVHVPFGFLARPSI